MSAPDGRALPWTFLQRQVRPYALAVSIACAVIVVSTLTESGVGQLLDTGVGKAIGLAAGVTTALLWVGWWSQSKRFMDQGLLLATATWAAIAATVLIEGSSWPSGALGVAWCIASGGAWLLETSDRGRRER